MASVDLKSLPASLPASFGLHSARCWIDGRLQPGTLTVADGKVDQALAEGSPQAAGGADGKPAAHDIPVYDVGQAVITPGLVSGHATLGLERWIDTRDLPDASFVTAADCLSASKDQRQTLVDEGLLRVLLSPGSANPIAGSVGLVRLGAAAPILEREMATKLVLSGQARDPNRFPSSLAGQYRMLQQALTGVLLESRIYLPEKVEKQIDAQREAVLRATASGKRLALFEAQTDAEIRTALDLIEEFQLRAALVGASQLEPFIDRMRELQVAVIVDPIRPTTFDWFSADLVLAEQAGLAILFAGEDAQQLRLSAALSGISHDAALGGLCDPLAALPGQQSAFSAGAAADIVIWDASPVNLAAKPMAILQDGQRLQDRKQP